MARSVDDCNRTAVEATSVIIAQSGGDSAHAMVVLESVMVGVLGHYFKGVNRFRVINETLDLVTQGVVERLVGE